MDRAEAMIVRAKTGISRAVLTNTLLVLLNAPCTTEPMMQKNGKSLSGMPVILVDGQQITVIVLTTTATPDKLLYAYALT